MGDPHAIESVEALREVIAEPMPGLQGKVEPRIFEEAREYIERSPFVVLSTCDAEGNLDASPKGDAPGFCLIEDERTIVIPDRPGNRLAYGLRNILETGKVGLIFMVPNTPETVRINGRATITKDPALLERLAARKRPAVLAIRVEVDECFYHCAKAFIRSKLWQPDSWQEKMKISFGAMFAKKAKADAEAARAFDAAIEADYRDNL